MNPQMRTHLDAGALPICEPANRHLPPCLKTLVEALARVQEERDFHIRETAKGALQ